MIGLGLFMTFSDYLHGQGITHQYKASKTVSYAFPSVVNIDSITSYDLASVRPYTEESNVVERISPNNQLSIMTLFSTPAGNPNNWPNPIYGILSNINGTTLLDQNGGIISTTPLDASSLSTYLVESNQVMYYFSSAHVVAPTLLDIAEATNAGYSYMTYSLYDATAYQFANDSFKVILIPAEQIVKTYTLKSGTVQSELIEKFQLLSLNSYVRLYTVESSYLPLIKGGRLKETVRTIFSEQYIGNNPPPISSKIDSKLSKTQNEIGLSSYVDEPVRDKIETPLIYPNPANDFINVSFGGIENGTFDVNIYSMQGIKLKSHYNLSLNQESSLSTDNLSAGIYLIEFVSSTGSITKQFSKN